MYTSSSPTQIDQCVILRNVYFYGLDRLEFGLVLTPTCDFAQNKAELVHLCALYSAKELIDHLKNSDWKKVKPNELRGQIKQVVTQRLPRYHFFPPLPKTSISRIADFQVITSLSLRELLSLEIVAMLESPYREQVPARYAAYMGRVGTPDFASSNIDHWIDQIIAT